MIELQYILKKKKIINIYNFISNNNGIFCNIYSIYIVYLWIENRNRMK